MKYLLMSLLLAFGLVFSQASTYDVDKAHSSVGFTISHMTISEVTGSFPEYTSTIVWDEKNLAAAKIEVTLPLKSIDTKNKDRDAHLQKEDFFDVAKFPEIKVVLKSVKLKAGTTYDATADITIRGTTKTVAFPLTVTGELLNPMYKVTVRGFAGSFKISRKDFKVGDTFPAAMVGDEVNVKFAVEAVKKEAAKK